MRKILTTALAALTLGGAALAAAAPASADPHGWHGGGGGGDWHGGGGHDWHGGGWRGDGWRGDDGGAALVAGIAGLAIGATLADHSYGYGSGPYYGGGPGYYDEPYATCYASRRVWDGYAGRYIIERTPYAC